MNLLKMTAMTAAAALLSTTAMAAEAGRDGQVNILYWQAPSTQNPYLSGGTKDIESSSLVLEPLANYNENGEMLPTLAAEIPTLENGGVSEDLTSITWKLKDGVVWADGSAFTAADVVFTANYCMDPDGGCNASNKFAGVASVEAVDDLTVKITFEVPKPFPYAPFVGADSPIIQMAQFKDCMGAKAPTCTDANFGPVGTGPYMVTEFKANDVVLYDMNPKYREVPDGKPAFKNVYFKGGGDAAAAARSVLETGEFDYAWNLQVEPEILSRMEAKGVGKVNAAFGPSVERMMVNQTNPDPALGEARATVEHPHPFLTDPKVVKAMSMAIDRQILVDAGYGAAGKVTCNVLPAPAAYASTANDWCKTQDVDGANKLLDEAGWVDSDGDGVRDKDGVKLSVLYQTSTNGVRQGTQALIKQMWGDIGVETELKNISASVFFGGDPSSPDTFQRFYSDIEMFTNNFPGTDPEAYMGRWVCDEIPSPARWIANNVPRYCDPAYDELIKKYAVTAEPAERQKIAKELNDMLMQAGAMIPLIHRGRVAAHSLKLGGVNMTAWDSELYNIEDWVRAQ